MESYDGEATVRFFSSFNMESPNQPPPPGHPNHAAYMKAYQQHMMIQQQQANECIRFLISENDHKVEPS